MAGFETGALLGAMLGDVQRDRGLEIQKTMESYKFTIALIKQHHLEPLLVAPRGWFSFGAHQPTDWDLYTAMKTRFICQFDGYSQTISMSFLDRSPVIAKQVLEFYVGNLRDQLRQEKVRSSEAAVIALTNEARQTSDPVLQNQLFIIVAQQIRTQKLAQVNADYAFKILDGNAK